MKLVLPILMLSFFTACSSLMNPESIRVADSAPPVVEKKETTPSHLKKKLVVIRFGNKSRFGGEEMANYSTGLVKNGLISTDEFIVVPQEEMEDQDQFINEFGEYNYPLIFKRARSHGVAGIVLGRIEELNVRETGEEIGLFRSRRFAVIATVRVQLFDANTEREVTSQLTSADVTEEHTDFFKERTVSSFDAERGKVAVSKALQKVLPTLPMYAKKIAWTGRIAKIDFHRYYINAGEMTGIRPGQLLKIYDEGQPVTDPDTNNLIGMAPGRMKGLLKVIGHFGTDGSVAIVHSGAGFKEKDRVEIFIPVQN